MFEEYIVQPGDTLYLLSNRYGVPVSELINMNDLGSMITLQPGVSLKIPVNSTSAFQYYTIQPGDTLTSLSRKFGITERDLEALNGLDPNSYLYPGDRILVPREGVYVYITKPGDQLQNIAKQYNIPVENILVYNSHIYLLPDQVIAFRVKQDSES